VSAKGGPGITAPVAGRGCAFGDYDNDGNVDVIVNCVNSLPQLLRCESEWKRNWIKVKVIGTKSNRTGIGARVRVLARTGKDSSAPLLLVDEVRSGGSYYSQNDLRLHFGLDQAQVVDSLEVRWPSGQVDSFKNLDVNRLYVVEEGAKSPKPVVLTPSPMSRKG
jgi:enediyne biosynthesis protein E4